MWAMFTFKQKPYPKLSTSPPKPASWAFQLPPTTGCSPTTRAVAGHEPECKFCNTADMFLQIQVKALFSNWECFPFTPEPKVGVLQIRLS